MKRIAAVVINSVSHDARVLKEADSLARAGFDVAVFGIQDNRDAETRTVRESGVVIHRVDWKAAAHHTVANAVLVLGLMIAVLVGVILLILAEPVHAFVQSVAFIRIGAIALAAIMAFLAWRKAKAFRTIGTRLEKGVAVPRTFSVASVVDKLKNALFGRVRRRLIVEALTEHEPDAVHCHDLNAVPVGAAYKAKHKCPLVFDSHEIYEEQSQLTPYRRWLCRRQQQRYSPQVDGFITINDSIGRYLRERYPALPQAVIIKNATLPPDRPVVDDGRLRSAAGVAAEGQKILLYQGGFSRFRGLEALVASAPLLPDDWTLVMMGWGALEAHLKRKASQVDASGTRIRFIPAAPHSELAFWTAGASLGVIPYENVCLNHWYCTPNKLWEYPQAGVPMLVSPFEELRATVEKHDIGVLLPDPCEPRGIADAVRSLSDDDLERMRRNCTRFIERDNWRVYEDRLIDFYHGLLRTRKDRIIEPSPDGVQIGPASPVAAAE